MQNAWARYEKKAWHQKFRDEQKFAKINVREKTRLYGSSSASFMACVEERINERESRKFEEGLNTKVKIDIYV